MAQALSIQKSRASARPAAVGHLHGTSTPPRGFAHPMQPHVLVLFLEVSSQRNAGGASCYCGTRYVVRTMDIKFVQSSDVFFDQQRYEQETSASYLTASQGLNAASWWVAVEVNATAARAKESQPTSVSTASGATSSSATKGDSSTEMAETAAITVIIVVVLLGVIVVLMRHQVGRSRHRRTHSMQAAQSFRSAERGATHAAPGHVIVPADKLYAVPFEAIVEVVPSRDAAPLPPATLARQGALANPVYETATATVAQPPCAPRETIFLAELPALPQTTV